MENFISVIINKDKINEHRDIVLDSIITTGNVGLLETEIEYEIYESENNTQVISVPLSKKLSEKQQEMFAKKLANKLFDKGHTEFDIEFGLTEDETIARTLRSGMRGEDVRRIQREIGMPAADQDGIFGPKTERAIRNFQQNAGIQVDGIVGQQTQSAILKYRMPGTGVAVQQPGPAYIDAPYPKTQPPTGPSRLRQRQQQQQQQQQQYQKTSPTPKLRPKAKPNQPPVGGGDNMMRAIDRVSPIKVTTQDQANSILQNPNATPAEIKAAREFYGAAAAGTPSSRLDRAGETPSTGRSTSPVQPIGRMSSARPNDPETGAVVRPGDETNALDAIAQDRETGALPQPPAQDTATPTRSGPTTRGDRRGPRPDPNANAPQPDAQTTVNSPSGDTSGGDSGVNNNATTDPEVSREIPQAPAFGGGERDVNVDTNAPSQAAPSVDPQVAQGVAGTFYQAMKGGTGIGTNKRQIQRQLAGLQNADEFRAAAEAYKDNNERDLFADFYDEMNDRHFNRFVRPELERLGIEIPTRDSFKNESVEPMPKGAFMVEDRAIWRSLYESTHYTNGKPRPRTFITESKMQEVTFHDDDEFFEAYGVLWFNEDEMVDEAEYQGRKVKLGKPMAGDVKKFKVYVKNPKGNVVKVNFGQKGAKIKKNNPERRRSFRARHNCDNPGPRHKARYWSCRKW